MSTGQLATPSSRGLASPVRASARLAVGLLMAASPLALQKALALPATGAYTITPKLVNGGPATVTATTVSPATSSTTSNAKTVTVSTTTTSGTTAFNAFTDFTVGKSVSVNLVIPTGTKNLVNTVDNPVVINGTVYSTLNINNGAVIAGHVFFLAPNGFLLGPDGSINVGALTVATASASLAGSNGQLDLADFPTSAVLGGTVPLDGTGTIDIQGKINASGINDSTSGDGSVSLLSANAVTVESGAQVNAGGAAPLAAFTAIVNASGGTVASATGVVNADGGDVILTGGSFTLDNGGSITSTALGSGADGAIGITVANSATASVGDATTNSPVTLDGTLSGGAITVSATASSTASLGAATATAPISVTDASITSSGAIHFTASATGGGTLDFVEAAADATMTATIDILGSTVIDAHGAVTMGSTAGAIVNTTGALPGVLTTPADASGAVALVSSTARTQVAGTASITTHGTGSDVSLTANNTVTSNVNADASASGSTTVAGSAAVDIVTVSTTAEVDGSATVNSSGGLGLNAESQVGTSAAAKASATGGASSSSGGPAAGGVTAEYLDASSGPGAKYASDEKTPEGQISATGALAINDLTSTTLTTLTSSGAVTAAGALSLTSQTQNSGSASADGSAATGATGIGVGLALDLAKVANNAILGQSVTAGSFNATATMVGTPTGNAFSASAVSGAGATNVGLAGSLAVNLLDSQSEATLSTGVATLVQNAAVTGADGSLTLMSDDETSATAAATPAGDGASSSGKVGVGASVALNLLATRSIATIATGVTVTGAGAVTLTADSDHVASTQADMGSAGGVSVTPVVALSLVDDQTSATIGDVTGDLLTLGDLTVTAQQFATEATEANGASAGGAAAVGAAVALAIVTDDVTATTASSLSATGDIAFSAKGASLSNVGATASASGGNDASDDSSSPQASNSGSESQNTDDKIQGLGASATSMESGAGVGSTSQDADGSTAVTGENGSGSSPEGKVAVAAAIAVDIGSAKVEAYVPAAQSVTTAGALNIAAVNNTDALTAASASQVGATPTPTPTPAPTPTPPAPKVGIGAAVAITLVHTADDAVLGGTPGVTAAGASTYQVGSLSVTALNSDLGVVTPTLPGATSVAPPAVVDNTNPVAGRPDQFGASATSGAGASDVGLAGSLGVDLVDTESVANVATGTVALTSSGALTLGSDNETSATAAATPVGAGASSSGKVGIGASVALNLLATRSQAAIADGVTVTGAGAVTLTADATHAASTQADQGSAGGISVTPVVALSLVDDQTSATIGAVAGGTLDTTSLNVTAFQLATEATEANGASAGGAAAVGAAVALAIVTDDVTATTSSSLVATTGGVSFSASGASLSNVGATASASGGNDASDDSSSSQASNSGSESENTDDKIQGLGSSATTMESNKNIGSSSQHTDGSSAVTGENGSGSTSEGKIAVAAAIAVDIGSAKVEAYVPAAQSVNASGALTIAAVNNTDALTAASASQTGATPAPTPTPTPAPTPTPTPTPTPAGSKVGIGAAVAITLVHAENDAILGGAPGQTATSGGTYQAGSLTVTALNSDLGAVTPTLPGASSVAPPAVTDTTTPVAGRPDQFGASAVSGAGASDVGISGSVGIDLITSTTTATVAAGTVTIGGGAVTVQSDNQSSVVGSATPTTDGVDGDKVGIGASVALNTVTVGSNASIANGVGLSGADALTIGATDLTNTTTTSKGGAKGGTAVDAVVSLAILSETTSATLGSGTASTVSGSVGVTAESSGTNTATALGAVDASSKAGVGAAASVITGVGGLGSGNAVTSTTAASIDRDLTTTNAGNLTLTATSTRTYDAESTATAGGGSSTADSTSDGGSSSSSAVSQDTLASGEAQNAENQTQTGLNNSSSEDSAGSGTTTGSSGAASGGSKVSIAGAVGAALVGDSATAEVMGGSSDHRTLTIGGSLTVTASNTGDLLATGDASTTASTNTGIAIGAGLAVLGNTTSAKIDDDTHIVTPGTVTVGATSVENQDSAYVTRVTAQAMSGASMAKNLSVAGSLAVALSESSTEATVGNSVTIDAPTDADTQAGLVDVAATATAPLSAKAWAGTYSSSANSVGASIAAVVALDTVTGTIGTGAQIDSDGLDVTATEVKIDVPLATLNILLTDVQSANYDNARQSLSTIDTDAQNNALLGENNYYTEVLAGSASSDKNAIAGGFAVQYIGNTVNAEVGANARLNAGSGAVSIDAEDHTVSKALDGTVAAGGGGTGAGITSTVIYDGSQVTGSLDSGASVTHSGSLSVLANSAQTVDLFEASAAAADSNAIAGILGGVILNVGSHANVGAGSSITSAGAVDVAATDPISILNLAGAIAGSSETAIGATLIDTTVLNSATAAIGSSSSSTTSVVGRSLTVNAALTDNVIDLGIAGTAAGENAVDGVASPVYQGSTVTASIGSNATLSATAGAVMVTASDMATIYNVGGTLAVGGDNGIGGAAGVSIFSDTTTATIGDSATIDATGNLDVQAQANETVITALVSAAGGGDVGVAVALGSSVVTDTTQAYIGQGASVGATQILGATNKPDDVSITASDTTTITDVAGAVAGSGGTSGGAGADVDVLIKHTDAWFGQSSTTAPVRASTLNATGDVIIDAESSQSANAVVAGLAAGGDAGLAGSVSVYSLTGSTLGGIGQGDMVTASGNVAVLANDQNSVARVAGSVALGGDAAVGAAIGVTVSNQTTLASIGDNATVVALGDTSGMSVIGGFTGVFGSALSGTPTNSMTGTQGNEIDPITQADALNEGGSLFLYSRTASPNLVTRQGVIVDATNRDSVQGLAASGGLSGTVAFDLSGDVPVVISDTEATIGAHDSINATGAAGANQSVTVSAASDLYHQGIAAALSLSGSVGAGAGAEVNIAENTTKADIGDHSTVDAALNVSVTSAASEDFSGFAAGAAVAGDVAGAGAATAFVVTDTTYAGLGASDQVTASGNVVVTADDESRAIVTAGAVGAAVYVGLGASIGATIFDKTTTAEIGANAMVTGLGNGANNDIADYTGVDFTTQNSTSRGVQVQANSGESLDTVLVAGGAAAFAAIAGSVSVEELTGTTQATIDDGAKINVAHETGANADQSVAVTARDSTVLATLDGALAGAISGTTGAFDIAVLNNTTSASIGDNATIDAAANVYVAGLVNQNTSSAVISVGAGIAAVAGSVSVLTVADGPSPQQTSDLQGSDGEANTAISDNYADSGLSQSSNPNVSGTSQTAVNDKAALTVSSALTASPTPPGVSAKIGNDVQISAGGAVDARSRDMLTTDALAPTVAAGIGVGAGVSVVSVDYTNTATIGTGGTLGAGSVDVSAHTDHTFSSDVIAFTAIGGAAAATAVTDTSATSANLGGNDSTTGALTVESYSGDTGNLLTGSVAVGIAGGVAVATLSPSAETTVSANASLTAGTSSAADLSVTATGYENLTTNTASAAVGGAGAGIDVAILSPTTEATVEGGGPLHAEDGNIFVTANNSATLNSFAAGIAILGDVGGAASVYKIADTTTSSVGASTLTASSAANITANDTSSVTLETGGGAAGIAGIGASLGLIISSDGAGATVDGATINAATIDIAAEADKTYTETVVAGGAGAFGAGFSAGVILDGGEGSSSQGTSVYSSESSALTGGSTSGTSSQNQGDSALASAVPSTIAAGSIGAMVEGSTLTAGSVTVAATSKISTTQNDGALGVGLAAGVGGGVGYTALTGSVTASIDPASTVTAGQIGVTAIAENNGGDAAHINAIVGSAGGLLGLGAAVAVADDNQSVTAQAGGALTGTGGSTDSLTVQATDSTSAATHTYNVAIGTVGAGAVVSIVDKTGSVDAQITPTTSGQETDVSDFNSVDVSATAEGSLASNGVAAAGGLVGSLNAAYVTAEDGVSTDAELGKAIYGSAPGGITVSALRIPDASAEADGLALAGGLAVGASLATATVDSHAVSQVANGASFADGASLTVESYMERDSNSDDSASAKTVAGSGSLFVSVNAAVATAQNNSSIQAFVGQNVAFGNGNLTIEAGRDSDEAASSTGIAVGGLLAAGAVVAEADVGGDTTAYLGSGLTSSEGLSAAMIGNLVIKAGKGSSTGAYEGDYSNADTTSGSGALISGSAASGTTNDTTIVTAAVDGLASPSTAAPTETIASSGTIDIEANHKINTESSADSTQAALAGGSGSSAIQTVGGTIGANVGSGVALESDGNFTISGMLTATVNGSTVTGAGGVVNGNAGQSTGTVQTAVGIDIGEGSKLVVLGDPNNSPGAMNLVVGDLIQGTETGTMTSGGVVEAPFVNSEVNATPQNSVTLESGVGLLGVGTIAVGDYSLETGTTSAEVSTYGGVGVAGGESDTYLNANNTVTLGSNVNIEAFGNVTLAAGQAGDGSFISFMNATATTDVYNETAIPISIHYTAKADTNNNTNLVIGSGSDIESVGNVNLISLDVTGQTSAAGTGHNPYLSLANDILSLVGASISETDSEPSSNTSSHITLDGTVEAGVLAKQTITIDQNGNITYGGALAAIPNGLLLLDPSLAIAATNDSMFNLYQSLTNQIAIEQAAASALTGDAQATANAAVTGLQLVLADVPMGTEDRVTIAPLVAAAGTITVTSSSLTTDAGSHAALTATGGATIAITDANPTDVLFANTLTVPWADAIGGAVNFIGGASAPSGVTVTQIDKGVLPTISIVNNAGTGKPIIVTNGDIDNYGGLVSLQNAQGDLADYGELNALQLQISVPNGAFVVPSLNGVFTAGSSPDSIWESDQLIGLSPTGESIADIAAMAILDSGGAYSNSNSFTSYLTYGAAGSALGYNQTQYTSVSINNNNYVTTTNNTAADGTTPVNGIVTAPWVVIFASPVGNTTLNNSGSGFNFHGSSFVFPNAPIETLTRSVSSSNVPVDPHSSIYAQSIIINANDINIDASVTAGHSDNYSVNLGSTALATYVGVEQALYNEHLLSGAPIDVSAYATKVNSGDQLIDVQYNPATQQYVLKNLQGSAGGFIELTGHIYNTSATGGEININNGYGTINVSNPTNVPVVINNIDAGSGSTAEVIITDFNNEQVNYNPNSSDYYQLEPVTKWYVEKLGQSPVVYDNLNSPGDGLSVAEVSSSQALQFNPQAGSGYVWTQSWETTRTVTLNGDSLSSTVGNWLAPTMSMGSGSFETTNQTNSNFYTTALTATIKNGFRVTNFLSGSFDLPNFSSYYIIPEYFPTDVIVTETSKVKADNAIAINFLGNQSGSVTINSTASVIIAGQITNPDGTTSITAGSNGSITETTGSISAKTLDLTSGSVGAPGAPLLVTLPATPTSAGTLNFHASNGGVVLSVAGAANIGNIEADNGNVEIDSSLGIYQGSSTPIVGDNVTLNSAAGGIGTSSAPILIGATVQSTATGQHGVLNASAQNDIFIEKTSGDLLIGTPEPNASNVPVGGVNSTLGNVTLIALQGNIANASTAFTVDTANQNRLATVWTTLNLENASAATAQTIVPFENQVIADYKKYWLIEQNATVTTTNNTVSVALEPSQTLLFASSALLTASPTITSVNYAPLKTFLANATVTSANGVDQVTLTPMQQAYFKSAAATALGIPNPSATQINTYAYNDYESLKASAASANYSLLQQIVANSTITTTNGVDSVSLTPVQENVFRSEAAAALGVSNPSASAIDGYVSSQYEALKGATASYVGAQYTSIKSFVSTTFNNSPPTGVSADYTAYQQIVNNSTITTVSNVDQISLTSTQQALFAPEVTAATGVVNPTNAEVASYVLAQYEALKPTWAGVTMPPVTGFYTYTPDWTYTLTPGSALYDSLVSGAGAWTPAQLANTINADALVPVGNTNILTQQPNITGKNVTLKAPNGQIGNNLALNITSADGTLSPDGGSLIISLANPAALTTTDDALLAAAAPGDLTINYTNNTPTSITVQLPHLVGLSASGAITATAAGNIFLGSNGSGEIADVAAANGQVRLDFGGSITNGAATCQPNATSCVPAVQSGFLILEAANGDIGTAAKPLTISLFNTTSSATPILDSARATGNVYISEVLDQNALSHTEADNLNLGVVYAGSMLELNAQDGAITAYDPSIGITYAPGVVRIQGGSIDLTAKGAIGTNGSPGTPLQVQVTAGLLTATGASLSLYSPSTPLALGASNIGGFTSLTGAGFDFDGAFVDSGGLNVSSTGAVIVAAAGSGTPAGSIIGNRGSAYITAPTITVGAGGAIEMTNATGAGVVALRATSGALTFGAGTTIEGGSLALNAYVGAISAGASDIFNAFIAPVSATSVDAAFTAGASVTFGADDTVQSKTSIAVTGQNDILGATDSFTAGSTITLTGSKGVSGATGDLLTAGSGITSVSGTAAFGNQLKATTTTGLIALTTTVGTLALGQSDTLTAPTVSLTAKGMLNVGSGDLFTAKSTDVSLTGATMVFGSQDSLTAARNIAVTSLGTLTGGSAIALTANIGAVNVTATDIELGQSVTAAAPLAIAFTATSGGVVFGGSETLHGQSVTLSGRTTATLGAGAQITTTGGKLEVTGANLNLGANDVLRANGELELIGTGTVMGSGTETLSSTSGLLDVTGQSIIFQGPLYATSYGPMTLTALAGPVQIGAESSIEAYNTLALNAPGGLTVGAATTITVGSSFSWTDYQAATFGAQDRITVGGSVTGRSSLLTFASGDSLTANGAINLTTTGGGMVLAALKSNQGSGPAITLTSATTIWGDGDGQTNLTTGGSAGVVMTAGGDIGSSSIALSMKTNSLTATGRSNMWLKTIGNLLTRKTTAPGTIMLNGQKVASN